MKKAVSLILLLITIQSCGDHHSVNNGIEPTAGQWAHPSAAQFQHPLPPKSNEEKNEIKAMIALNAFESPPSPAYPAGHSTVAACYGEMLAYLFPIDAKEFHELAEEETLSRFEAGVHLRTDNETGIKPGKEVALEIIKRAKLDGADTGLTANR